MGSTPPPVAETAGQDPQLHRADESGQGMVEYAFIVVLIAIALIVALQVLGHSTNNLFSNISNGLGA